MTTTVITSTKAMVEVADWDKVRVLVDELFPSAEPTAEPTTTPSPQRLAEENARVALQNGSLSAGLAREAADTLGAEGLNIVSVGNADRFDFQESALIVYSDKPYTRQVLVELFGIEAENVSERLGQNSDLDLVVILGRDYAQRVGSAQ